MTSENNKTIIKNIGVLMVSQMATWGLSLLLTIFLPRYLGPSDSGKLSLAVSLWLITSMFISFGLDMLLTKEIARKPTHINDFVGTAIFLRLILFGIGLLVLMVFVQIANYARDVTILVIVIGVSTLLGQFALPMKSALDGLEKMEYTSLGIVAGKLFTTIFALILLFAGQGLIVISFVLIGASLFELILLIWFSFKAYYFRPRVDFSLAKWMLRAGFPFLMVSMSQVVYAQIDMIVMSLLVSTTVVLGWYGAADTLFGTMLFIPSVFMTATFPAFSKMHAHSGEELVKLFRKSYELIVVLGVAVGLGIFIVAQPLVVLLFGEAFRGSGPVLAIMGIVIVFMYQNMILGQYMVISDRQNEVTKAMFTAAGLTVVLDLFLVPWTQNRFGNGAIGGALAYVVTESLMVIWFVFLIPKGVLTRHSFWLCVRAAFAGVVMVAVSWWFRNWFIAVPVLIGALTFMLMTAVLRLIPAEDWMTFRQTLQKALAKLPIRRNTQAI